MSSDKEDRPTREQLELFTDRLQVLLDRERGAEEEQTRLLNSRCSQKLLEQRGLALGGLGIGNVSLGLGGKSLVELVRPIAYHTTTTFPSHTFRNGDPARLEAFNPKPDKGKGKQKEAESKDAEGVEGIVYRISAEKIVLAVEGEVDLPERLRLIKLANSVVFDRMDKTVTRLQKDISKYAESPLARTLLGLDPPQHTGIDEPAWLTDLNGSQRDAIRFAMSASTVACIHGPPGTGKTHTLVELIYQLLSRPASPETELPPKILICTPSNLALDNILLRLYKLSATAPYSEILPRRSILRIGHPTRVHRDMIAVTLDYKTRFGNSGDLVRDIGKEIDGHLSDLTKKRGEKGAIKGRERGKKWEEVRALRKDYRVREGKVVQEVVKSARVVLATCHSAGSRLLNNAQFDICIIDEATQAVEPVCWVPILKSKKLVLAGDPQQLPPTIKSKAGSSSGTKANWTREKGVVRKPEKKNDSESEESEEAGVASAPKKETKVSAPRESTTEANNVTVDSAERELTNGVGKLDLADDGPPTHGSLESKATTISEAPPAVPTDQTKPHRALCPKSLEETLFDRLERTYPSDQIKRVLKVQYRMHADIASFPSDELYESALISHESVASHTLRDLFPPIGENSMNDGAIITEDDLDVPPVIFFDTAGCEFYERSGSSDESPSSGRGGGIDDDSKSNANEASIAIKWTRHLLSLGLRPVDIGIVTPYQAQVSLLTESLSEEVSAGLTIGSVDGLQGQEREAVILSLVRSNSEGEIGFLGEYRRMNVAMTRAKRHLCVIGDSATVGGGGKKDGYLSRWMGWLEEHAEVRYAGDEI